MGVGLRGRLGERARARLLADAFDRSAVPKAVISLAPDAFGVLVDVNPAFADLAGRKSGDLIGHPSATVLEPEDTTGWLALLGALAHGNAEIVNPAAVIRPPARYTDRGEVWLDRPLVRRDGARVWVRLEGHVARDEDDVAYLLVDVTVIPPAGAAIGEPHETAMVDPIGPAGLETGGNATTGPGSTAVSDATVPHAAVPDAAVPGAAVPDAAPSDAAVPNAAVPNAAPPDAAVLDAARPDAAPSDAAVPNAAIPNAAVPDVAAPRAVGGGRSAGGWPERAFEDSPIGMILADSRGRFVRVNAAFGRLVGRAAGELIGVRMTRSRTPMMLPRVMSGSGLFSAIRAWCRALRSGFCGPMTAWSGRR